MKGNIKLVVSKYLKVFPSEKERLFMLENYLNKFKDKDITDWNNKNGHLTVGAFVYCKEEDKFLILYHKDLEMYLYPGGHVDKEDECLFDAAKRELKEETGLENLELLLINDEVIPFDIDIHLIPYNDRVNMKEHYHFDFRYLFFIDKVSDINLDREECKNYKWVKSIEISKDKNYGNIVNKLKELVNLNNKEEVDIYDENKNKTGRTKIRHKDTLEKGEYIIGVQAIIINSKKQILISQRSGKKDVLPLKWECNGGALLSGEDVIDGIIREIYEELGIKLEKDKAIYLKTAKNSERFKEIYLFKKDINIEDIKFRDDECIDAKWVGIDEFTYMLDNGEIVNNVDFNKEDYENCLNLLKLNINR